MRRVLFWMHLCTGTLLSVLVIFFSITGALLAYEGPILRAADRQSYGHSSSLRGIKVASTELSSRAHRGLGEASVLLTSEASQKDIEAQTGLSLDTVVAQAARTLASPIEMITIHQDPLARIEIQTADHNLYWIDPAVGAVTGPQSPRLRRFFAEVTGLHRWFGLSDASHTAAIAVKGATALLLLFLLISGAILWMPRVWTRYSVRAGIVPRFDGHTRALNLSWHKVTGFWIALPLGIIVTTGAIMAYPWANGLLFRLAGSPMPSRNGNGGHRRGPGQHSLPPHLDEAFAQAVSSVPGWQSASLRLPTGGPNLNISVDTSEGGHPERREQVVIDASTLRVLHREPFAALSRGQQWRSWVRFAHTGEAGGWWGETLALFTAIGAAVLSGTGIVLVLNRFDRWRRRSVRHA
jgi:uncharacterized iron-regulated membrane protein